MANYAIVTDLNRCTGCLACTVACKAINGVDVGNFWIKTLRIGPHPTEGGSGHFPDVEMYFLPVQCQHCENPECVHVCPTGASYKDPDTGVVLVDKSKCIGCKYCMMACPYGVRSFNEQEKVVEKCTLCSQLTAAGDDVPACVHNCPTGARFFGDLDDPESDASKELAKYDADAIHSLPDPGNAHPATKYILSPSIAAWKELI